MKITYELQGDPRSPLEPFYCRIPAWANAAAGPLPEWFGTECCEPPAWFDPGDPVVAAVTSKLRLLCLLQRAPWLVVPCGSLGEWEQRKPKAPHSGRLCTADYGLTPYLLGDGRFRRAGFFHVSRAVLRKEFGSGWLPYCDATQHYIETTVGTPIDWSAPQSKARQYRTWHLELQRELFHSGLRGWIAERSPECRPEVAKEAMEVLRVVCFGVSADTDEFEALAGEAVREQERYREARIAIRTSD